MRVLVIGLGSIGQRHAKNLMELGYQVDGCDPRGTNHAFVESWYADLHEALAMAPEAIIIAVPPADHAYIAVECMLAGARRLLIEKPLASTLNEALLIQSAADKTSAHVAVGYQLRACHTLMMTRRDAISPYAFHAVFAYDMAKWRTEPATYQGNILLEASHELEYLLYMFGDVERVRCDHTKLLGTWTGRDAIVLTLRFKSGVCGTVHLDGRCPEYWRHLTIYSDTGLRWWAFDKAENDEAYKVELQRWLAGDPVCTLAQGLDVMRLVAAIRQELLLL